MAAVKLWSKLFRWLFALRWYRTNHILAKRFRERYPWCLGCVTCAVEQFASNYRQLIHRDEHGQTRPLPPEVASGGVNAIFHHLVQRVSPNLKPDSFYFVRIQPSIQLFEDMDDKNNVVLRRPKLMYRLYVAK